MQNGSSASKAIGDDLRVNFQFIVKVKGAQSVSTIPVKGCIPSLGWFRGPVTIRSYPGSVRNRPFTLNVSTPKPKWLDASRGVSAAVAHKLMASSPELPSHCVTKGTVFERSHPWVLAMLSGRQR